MLDVSKIRELFHALNDELSKMNVMGEIGLCGGAVMCLVFQARETTKDIDAIFEPTRDIRKAAERVAKRFGIDKDWLNDAAKAFFFTDDPPKQNVFTLSHLRVWAPRADYMLAMKCISARFDTHDRGDVQFLLKYLKLKNPEQVFDRIEKYYPKSRIPAKTRYLIEELLG